MDRTIILKLKELGLSEKEAVLYLTLFTLDEAPVHVIAKMAKLERSTTYVLLESLLKRGVIERVGGETLRYRACKPDELLRVADTVVTEAKVTHDAIHALTEKLETQTVNAKYTPRATYFDTAEGLTTLRHEVDRAVKQVVRAFLHSNDVIKVFSTKNKDSRFVVAMRTPFHTPKISNPRLIRFIPKNRYPFDSDLFIFDDKIVVISDDEEFAIRIESKDFADVIKEAFDLSWEEVGRLDVQIRNKSSKRRS